MTRRGVLQAAAAALAGALLPACGGGSDDGVPVGRDTLLQLLQQDSRFSLFLEAAGRAGLTATLASAAENLTLFAAENAAFDALAERLGRGNGAGLLATLSDDQWGSILRFALLSQRRSLGSLRPSARVDTRYQYRGDAAQLIFVTDNGRFNLWDGVGRTSIELLRSDIAASNGVLHVASDVLLPRGVLTVSQMLRASIDSFSDFAGSMSTSDIALLDGTGPFTLFAPVNNAVTAPLSSNLVRHHAMTGPELDGDDFPVQATLAPVFGRQLVLRSGSNAIVLATLSYGSSVQANVTDVDFFASNGVIHVIDAVIPL